MRLCSDNSDIQIECLLNNRRSGATRPHEEIFSRLKECDILIFQPLGDSHGKLSRKSIINARRAGAVSVSFPYIFNSGMYSLGHAPMAKKHSYGEIYGEEIITDSFQKTGFALTYRRYKKGQIDFL